MNIKVVTACFVAAIASGTISAQEKIEGITVPSSSNQTHIPRDKDGTYLEYSVRVNAGNSQIIDLGKYPDASACGAGVSKALVSNDFQNMIKSVPVVSVGCVVVRKK